MKKKLAIITTGVALTGYITTIPSGWLWLLSRRSAKARLKFRIRNEAMKGGIYHNLYIGEHLNSDASNETELPELAKTGWRPDPLFRNRSITQILPS